MAKPHQVFFCTKCDAQFPKWEGRCRECGAWGTLQAMTIVKNPVSSATSEIINLSKVVAGSDIPRLSSGLAEFDRVLGGGFVPGAIILVGGDPGIGKSTLLMQVARHIAAASPADRQGILYISGEESAEQIKQRLDRLGQPPEAFHFLADTSIASITNAVSRLAPKLVIVDSLQTIRGEGDSIMAKPAELRTATENLMNLAKRSNTVIILIGHVTKEGAVAGPKAIEHLVDAVLYLEKGQDGPFRILRAVKNRFGGVSEIGLWQMTDVGLTELTNPSAAFLGVRRQIEPGSCITALLQGSRVFLVEVQALVSKARFGYPQRRATGFDVNRFQLILAVLTKIVRLPLNYSDVHLNVVGGLKSAEPATDLAVALAIASACKNTPIQDHLLAIGELGLQGELRAVNDIERRLAEAGRLGFVNVITPPQKPTKLSSKLEQLQAKTIVEAIDIALV
jgi:DNA repair protein RadA/Sms